MKGRTQEIFAGKVQLFNPRGRRVQFETQWQIANLTAPPRVMGPQVVEQGPTLEFMVMGEDINNEEVPQWRVFTGPSRESSKCRPIR